MFKAEPKKERLYQTYRKLAVSAVGLTSFYGWDVGMGGTGVLAGLPQEGVPAAYAGLTDIAGFFKEQFAIDPADPNATLVPVTYLAKMFFTLRNQANIGCHLKVYYIKVPRGMSHSYSDDTIQEIINKYQSPPGVNGSSVSADIRELPGLSRDIRIYKTKVYQFMPGETKQFFLKTGWRNPRQLKTVLWNRRMNVTRSILFQVTGFPLHAEENEQRIGFAPHSIDVVSYFKQSGRIITTRPRSVYSTYTGTTIETPVFQQWQSGQPDTTYGA